MITRPHTIVARSVPITGPPHIERSKAANVPTKRPVKMVDFRVS
jgi:hypothetical protein